jgi:hypothetical protein
MHILSALSYFFSAHSLLAMPVIVLLSAVVAVGMVAWRKNNAWSLLVVGGLVFSGINVFTSHIWNALLLNAFGVTGSAVVVQSRETSSQLNNQNVWEYDAVIKTADGRDVTTKFDTMSASIYPIRNEILIPPQGEMFVVKYVPGFERNIVILSDQSDYGKKRLIREDLEPVEKAEAELAVSPANPDFMKEYRNALQSFLEKHRNDADPALIRSYQQKLDALGPAK